MKKWRKILAAMLSFAMLFALTACGTVDFKTGVQGTWAIYHWYENAENGEDVFLDDTNFYTVVVTENSFTVTAEDDSLEGVGGTYEWTKADEAEVVMNDGTRCTMRISENSKEHNEMAVWDIYIVETNMYYCLETTGETE